MLSSTENIREEIAKKKAALIAEMAELARKEKEAVEKEEEAARNAEAAWLAAEKAAKKEVKKGKKHAVEESGAEGSKPKKRVKTVVADEIETAKVSCKRQAFIKIFFAFVDCIRCVANKRDCVWVRDGRAKLCLACGKAKQKCIGAVWEQGEGMSGELSGSAVGELGGMAAMMREMVEAALGKERGRHFSDGQREESQTE